MPIYSSVAAHPILTAKALSLTTPVFEAHQDLAEALLRLGLPIVTDALALSRVALALALQINFQVEQGIDPLVEETAQSTHSAQFIRYRDRIINPQALAIVESVIVTETQDRYEVITSYRTRDA